MYQELHCIFMALINIEVEPSEHNPSEFRKLTDNEVKKKNHTHICYDLCLMWQITSYGQKKHSKL